MKKIRLALSGSGFLGGVHAGAICALLDAGYKIVEVAGSSGGSIAAALAASGLPAHEIQALATADVPGGITKFQPLALLKKSINTGEILHQWLLDVIGNRTFRDTVVPLSVMTTDIEAGRPFVFSTNATPDVKIADACRASAGVPFMWQPANISGKLLVDGGVVNNIPVDQLTIDDIPRIGVQVKSGKSEGKIDSVFEYAGQVLSTMLDANEGNIDAWARRTGAKIIEVDANPYNFLNAKLTKDQKTDLFSRGYFAVTSKIIGR